MAVRGDPKLIVSGEEVRAKMLSGARQVAESVAATYGPLSGNVAIGKSWGLAMVTHDGVTVAKDVFLADEVEDIGAGFVVEASSKTNSVAGDGTSATAILMYAIWEKAHRLIAAGANPMLLRKGINKASGYLKDEIDKLTQPIKDDKLHSVAAISAADPAIGKLVADTVVKVGVGITIEDYNGLGVLQDVVDGIYFEQGWSEPYFVTHQATQECVLDNCYILVTDKKIATNTDIVPILEKIGTESEHKKVLIIGNVSEQALKTCGLTHVRPESPLQICIVRPPVYGSQVLPFLEDIAAITGGKLLPAAQPSSDFSLDTLGFAKKIVVSKDSTIISEGKADEMTVARRVVDLLAQLASDKYTAFERERMELRLAKLQGKIGVIRVGGTTDSEREELKARVIDALHATRAAREEGIVPGGATTLLRLSTKELPELLEGDELEGAKLVYQALQGPFKRLVANAGEDPGMKMSQVLSSPAGHGFDIRNIGPKPIDLVKANILDPAKVIKQVVENATASAAIAITVDRAIVRDRQYALEEKGLNNG